MDIKEYTVGQSVFCYSFGSWYEGTVAKIGRTRLHVTYTTGSGKAGKGKTRTKDFPLDKIALEKPENSGRKAAAADKRKRRIAADRKMVGQPVMQMTAEGFKQIPDAVWAMDENGKLVVMRLRKLELGGMEGARLLCAFQALYVPSGFYGHGITHEHVRRIIQEMTGIKLKPGAKPPRAGMDLNQYIEWAGAPELQDETDSREVFLRLDDRDEGQYGVGIFFADDPEECQERIHAPSETAAFHNARMKAQRNGWYVIDEPEEAHADQVGS